MSSIACLFPGQGSQHVGMGKDIFDAFSVAKDTFDVANDILGFDLADLCFHGPGEKLKETRYTQPAILVHSVAAWRVIESKGFEPDYVAGHSVGEYSALVANGSLSYPDALKLVKVRAEAMYSAGLAQPGGMAALVGMSEEGLNSLLREGRKAGIVEAANYNSPAQVVVSGEAAGIERVLEIARSFGAKRAIRLNVSGAFHSPLMKRAEEELASALKNVTFRRAKIPLISNVTAKSVTEPADIAQMLERQLTSPVLWCQSMTYLADREVCSFVEVGPGNVLCGLLKRIDSDALCRSCSDLEGIETFVEEVSNWST